MLHISALTSLAYDFSVCFLKIGLNNTKWYIFFWCFSIYTMAKFVSSTQYEFKELK